MVQEINNTSQFLQLLKQYDVATNPYLSYSYLKCYLEYYQPKHFIGLVVLDDKGQIIALVPLEKEKRVIRLCGYKASNYNGIILTSSIPHKQVFPLIQRYLAKYYPKNYLFLYDINDQDPLFTYLAQHFTAIPQFSCPQTNVEQQFSALFEQSIRPGKKRTELRKFARRLEQMGEVEYVQIRDDKAFKKYEHLLPRLEIIHRERFSTLKTNSSVIFYRHWQYYIDLLYNMLKVRRAILSLVLLDGVVISFVYTLVADTTVIDWMVAFDLAFSKLSLGTVHLMHFLEYLCGCPEFTTFDFSKGDSPYKIRWSSATTTNGCFIINYNKIMMNRFAVLSQHIFIQMVSFLREKGAISWVNRLLGKRVQKLDTFNGTRVDDNTHLSEKLNYHNVAEFSVDERRRIVNELYTLLSVKK